MGNYRKKPVEIDAIPVIEVTTRAMHDLPKWVMDGWRNGVFDVERPGLLIRTLEGNMTAGPSDWLIRGVKGEFYACKPDIFELTYEAAEPKSVAEPEK